MGKAFIVGARSVAPGFEPKNLSKGRGDTLRKAIQWINGMIQSIVKWGSYMSIMALAVQAANWGIDLGLLALPLQSSGLADVESFLSAASFAVPGNEMVVDHPVDETWL